MLIRNLVLILVMLSLLPLGLFLMRRIDRFLDDGRKEPDDSTPSEGPSHVFFSEKSSDEEILSAIHDYRKTHDHISIVISEEEKDKK